MSIDPEDKAMDKVSLSIRDQECRQLGDQVLAAATYLATGHDKAQMMKDFIRIAMEFGHRRAELDTEFAKLAINSLEEL